MNQKNIYIILKILLHKLDRNLDTGPILYQAKPNLQTDWSYRHIEYSLTKLSCDIVPKAMEEVLKRKQQQMKILSIVYCLIKPRVILKI